MSWKTRYLICYDIADPKRLARLHRYLCKHAVPLQYSVFSTRLSPKELMWVNRYIHGLINPQEDDVRIYPLAKDVKWRWYGPAILPADCLSENSLIPPPAKEVSGAQAD